MGLGEPNTQGAPRGANTRILPARAELRDSNDAMPQCYEFDGSMNDKSTSSFWRAMAWVGRLRVNHCAFASQYCTQAEMRVWMLQALADLLTLAPKH